MEVFNSIKSTDGTKDLISVRAYKGDAMTLLCFDVDKSLTAGLAGFAIKFSCNKSNRFIFNRMTFSDAFLANNPQIPKSSPGLSCTPPIIYLSRCNRWQTQRTSLPRCGLWL